jgi:hypothetical protein
VPDKHPDSSRADHLKQYRWKKGQSGNPGGRAKGKSIVAELRSLLNEGIDDVDLAKALAEVAYKHALKGDFRFYEMILERMDGPVAQEVQIQSKRLIWPWEANGRPNDTDTPPSAGEGSEEPSEIQGNGLRSQVGENGAGGNRSPEGGE